MRRLWVQQTLAFSLVVIVTMGAVVVWINQTTVREFRKYITVKDLQVLGSGGHTSGRDAGRDWA